MRAGADWRHARGQEGRRRLPDRGARAECCVRPRVHRQSRAGLDRSRGARTAYIAPASPSENGLIEIFIARLRDEPLDGEIFNTLREAQIVIESWRRHYNAIRPRASLDHQAPAPRVFAPALAAWPAAQPGAVPPAVLPLTSAPALSQTLQSDHSGGAVTASISSTVTKVS
jgi:putative transposase